MASINDSLEKGSVSEQVFNFLACHGTHTAAGSLYHLFGLILVPDHEGGSPESCS